MKKHIVYLDYLRSYAMIMVVVLHCIGFFITEKSIFGTSSWYVNLVVNAFSRTAVPIFLMISGYLMLSSDSASDIKQFYKKRLGRILIPLVFWNVIYYAFDVIKHGSDFSFSKFAEAFLVNGTYYHLWYLYMLAALYLLTPFIKCITDKCTSGQLLILVLVMFSSSTIFPFVNSVTGVYVYLFDSLCNGYIPCFILGYLLATANFKPGDSVFFGIFGLICLILSTLINHFNSDAKSIELIANSGYSFCHIGLAASLFVIFRYTANKERKSVKTLAKHSFGVYLVHVMILEVVKEFFCIDASPIITSLYLFAVTFTISFAIVFLIIKVKYVNKIIT